MGRGLPAGLRGAETRSLPQACWGHGPRSPRGQKVPTCRQAPGGRRGWTLWRIHSAAGVRSSAGPRMTTQVCESTKGGPGEGAQATPEVWEAGRSRHEPLGSVQQVGWVQEAMGAGIPSRKNSTCQVSRAWGGGRASSLAGVLPAGPTWRWGRTKKPGVALSRGSGAAGRVLRSVGWPGREPAVGQGVWRAVRSHGHGPGGRCGTQVWGSHRTSEEAGEGDHQVSEE